MGSPNPNQIAFPGNKLGSSKCTNAHSNEKLEPQVHGSQTDGRTKWCGLDRALSGGSGVKAEWGENKGQHTGAAASQCVTPRGVRQFGGL